MLISVTGNDPYIYAIPSVLDDGGKPLTAAGRPHSLLDGGNISCQIMYIPGPSLTAVMRHNSIYATSALALYSTFKAVFYPTCTYSLCHSYVMDFADGEKLYP